MMRRNSLLLILTFIMLCGATTVANAEGNGGGNGGFKDDDVYVGGYFQIPGSGVWGPVDVGIPDDPNEYKFEYKCWSGDNGDAGCLAEDEGKCTAGDKGRRVYWFLRLKNSGDNWRPMDPPLSCIYAEKPQDIGEQIRGAILSEFQARPIVAGVLTLQPNPHTLIGSETNFYVAAGEQVFDFILFDQRIRISARPTEFEWLYGDGATYGPAPHAGAPLPQDRWGEKTATSHAYKSTGDYTASVIVYFSGEYSINGGPMVPIDGRATVPSAPVGISVWKSDSRNVADDCIVNPAGYGC
ncbi:hypothetical protein ACIQXM_02355 [Arthrobacter sp. NPDC097144]|uniref:hypothetical protein n=1 Tax=Arthrobacter sp. NPDC097144 TaxID=3363946 RepID=UPI0037F63753